MDEATCLVLPCKEERLALGFCSMHYTRWRKFGNVNLDREPPRAALPNPCDPRECDSKYWRLEWCNTHYRRRRRILRAQAHYEAQLALPEVRPVEWRCKTCGAELTNWGPKNFCSRGCKLASLPECSFDPCDKKIKHGDLCAGHAMQRFLGRALTPLQPTRGPGALAVRDDKGRKQCASCFEWLDVENYQDSSRQPDGLHYYCRECASFAGIQARYGITPVMYRYMLELQGGGCAMCKRPPAPGKRLVVDHDHGCCTTRYRTCGNCVRGLLCGHCNSGLGMLRDSTEVLAAGIEYLAAHRT